MGATKAQIEEGRRKKHLYETISTLGRGATGTVKLCRHRPSGQLVALKSINKPVRGSDSETKGAEDSFWKEVHALRKAGRHENLAQLLDAFETSSKFYLVLSYSSGGDLLKRIERGGPFTERSAATVILTILNALHYLHAHGIVHRDVKPANLLMRDSSENAALVLVDFGSSFSGSSKNHADVDGKDAMKTIAGTPFYLAPEIVKGQVYNEKVDIWSVGCIAYQLLCGATPFQNATGFQDLYNRIRHADFKFSPKLPISDLAKSFITSLLVADPDQRPTALQAMAHPWFQENVPICYFLLLKMYNHEADPALFEGPTAGDLAEYNCPVLVAGFAALTPQQQSQLEQEFQKHDIPLSAASDSPELKIVSASPVVPAPISAAAASKDTVVKLAKPLRAGWESFGKPGVFQIPNMDMPDSFYEDLVKSAPEPGTEEDEAYDAELMERAFEQSGFVWPGQVEEIMNQMKDKHHLSAPPNPNMFARDGSWETNSFAGTESPLLPSPVDSVRDYFSPKSGVSPGDAPRDFFQPRRSSIPHTDPRLARVSTDDTSISSNTPRHFASDMFDHPSSSDLTANGEQPLFQQATDPSLEKLEESGAATTPSLRRPSEVTRVKSLVSSLASFGMGSRTGEK